VPEIPSRIVVRPATERYPADWKYLSRHLITRDGIFYYRRRIPAWATAYKYYGMTVEHLLELVGPWEKIAAAISQENVAKVIQAADNLLSSSYEGMAEVASGEQAKTACRQKARIALENFSKKYPDAKHVKDRFFP